MVTPFLVAVLGTSHYPFERLVTWLDDWLATNPRRPGFVQHGATRRPDHAGGTAMIGRDELLDLMRQATVVVCHGGTGSVMDARACGAVPIVLPRVAAEAENVDDHQVDFALRLAEAGWIHVAQTRRQLHDHLDAAVRDATAYRTGHQTPQHERAADSLPAIIDRARHARPGTVRLRRIQHMIDAVRRGRGEAR